MSAKNSGSKDTTTAPAKKARHLALGAEGEARAAAYLLARGYRIEDRNVRAGGVEIDLVASRRGVIVFIEVKTRRSTRHGAPELSVGWSKQRRLIRGAAAWLDEHGHRSRRARFDVIAWLTEGPKGAETWRVTHYESAFDASR